MKHSIYVIPNNRNQHHFFLLFLRAIQFVNRSDQLGGLRIAEEKDGREKRNGVDQEGDSGKKLQDDVVCRLVVQSSNRVPSF